MAKHKFTALPLNKDIFNNKYFSVNINNLNAVKFTNNLQNQISNINSDNNQTSRKIENVFNFIFLFNKKYIKSNKIDIEYIIIIQI